MTDLSHFLTVGLSNLKYTFARIENGHNALSYGKAFVNIMEDSKADETLEQLEMRLNAELLYWRDLAVVKDNMFSDKRRYILLAYEHAFDILNSIKRQFHLGGAGNTFFIKRGTSVQLEKLG